MIDMLCGAPPVPPLIINPGCVWQELCGYCNLRWLLLFIMSWMPVRVFLKKKQKNTGGGALIEQLSFSKQFFWWENALWFWRYNKTGVAPKKDRDRMCVLSRLPLNKGWMMKTQRRWLWPWEEEAALTLTSVRNVLGRFSLHGLLLFFFTRPVTGPACEYLDCASIKMTPLCPQTDGKNIFWCHLKFHTTM